LGEVKWGGIRLLSENLGRRDGEGWVFNFFPSPKGLFLQGFDYILKIKIVQPTR
jgi:hypothetical protein